MAQHWEQFKIQFLVQGHFNMLIAEVTSQSSDQLTTCSIPWAMASSITQLYSIISWQWCTVSPLMWHLICLHRWVRSTGIFNQCSLDVKVAVGHEIYYLSQKCVCSIMRKQCQRDAYFIYTIRAVKNEANKASITWQRNRPDFGPRPCTSPVNMLSSDVQCEGFVLSCAMEQKCSVPILISHSAVLSGMGEKQSREGKWEPERRAGRWHRNETRCIMNRVK